MKKPKLNKKIVLERMYQTRSDIDKQWESAFPKFLENPAEWKGCMIHLMNDYQTIDKQIYNQKWN